MEEKTWDVIDSYFKSDKNFLTKHQIDSYNDFIYTKLPNTIKSLNPFITLKNDENTGKPKHEIRIFIGGENGEDIFFVKPNHSSRILIPNEARLKNLSYKSDIMCNIDIEYLVYDQNGTINTKLSKKDTLKNIKIGTIPLMLKSKLCVLYSQPDAIVKEMGECTFDRGGYFIVDGKEKVIVAQERIGTNRLFINTSRDPDYSHQGLIRCTNEGAAIFPKTINIGIYSSTYLKGQRKNAIVMTLPNITREIPIFILFRALGIESDKNILEHILYDLDDAANHSKLEFLYYSLRDGAFAYTQDQALEFLKHYVQYDNIDFVRYVLMNDLFPNMNEGSGDDLKVSLTKKALFLGHITNQIVKICMGLTKESDRDNYAFKRVDLSGFLMANLFRDYYNLFRNECRSAVDRQYNYGPWKKDNDLTKLINNSNRWMIFDSNIIENGLIRSLKGSWGINADPSKAGIVQDLSRVSYIGASSHLRRVNTPIDRSVKLVAPHRLHPTQWGAMCPCESPDGASIGLLKNFALFCHVSFDCSSTEIKKCLHDLNVRFLEYITPHELTANVVKVLVNSNWIGITSEPNELVTKLRLLRRNSLINVMTSIAWDIVGKEINISTEAGRCCRPIYIVHKHKLLINDMIIGKLRRGVMGWYDLIKGDTLRTVDITDCTYRNPMSIMNGSESEIWDRLKENQSVIEFIDVEESNTAMISMQFQDLDNHNINYTHCEIHPSTIFAILTASIPFANHNQAPRNYFSGTQGKQAIGIYSTSFNSRMDTMGLVLHYPQKRIVNTKYMEYIGTNDMPNGENVIVAIMTYTGYNQEDSVMINRAAIDRGLFNLTYYKTIVEKEESDNFGFEKIVFANPAELTKNGLNVDGFGKKFARYTKLDENGFPKENEKISEGDAYLGKCVVKTEYVEDELDKSIFKSKKKSESYRDKTMVADKIMSGTIDKVYVYEAEDGNKTCKIRIRKVRVPTLGDKHGSSHAQKGVVGMIIPPENMPYTKDGIMPDIIINPHAIPTRMTIGHLLECVFAKLGCLEGKFYDATPFCNQDISAANDRLQKQGYERYANEILYNGISGEQIPCEIFIGPTYYIRLKQMVQDKINSRHREEGGCTGLTRQPVKSRAKGGGLRIGEMESGALVAHGISSFLKESMMERSDKFEYVIDKATGDIAVANNKKGLARSLVNPDSADFSYVETPFSAKLFLQEMETMGIAPRLITDNVEDYDDFLDEYEGFDEDIINEAITEKNDG
jgi:DNA-directed RNA polymerase II subunit RPB2